MTVIWHSNKEHCISFPENRSYVILSAAITLDGKISTKLGDSKISCPDDLQRVHSLRASVDAIMIGIQTLIVDNPRLTVHHFSGKNPIRIIVDSNAKTPPTAKVLTEDKNVPTIIAITENAAPKKVELLKAAGATIITAGAGKHVDLTLLLNLLRKRGIKILMVEGGGTLNWGLLDRGLVDEVRIAIAPVMVGGKDAVTLVEGEGASTIRGGVKLQMKCIEQCGENLVLTYNVFTNYPIPKREFYE